MIYVCVYVYEKTKILIMIISAIYKKVINKHEGCSFSWLCLFLIMDLIFSRKILDNKYILSNIVGF